MFKLTSGDASWEYASKGQSASVQCRFAQAMDLAAIFVVV